MIKLLRSINCIYFYVDDLEHGISFYKSFKGLQLLWKTECQAGLGIEEDITEVILQTDPLESNLCFEGDDVYKVIDQITMMGGSVIKDPFDTKDGRRAIIKDPFGNVFQLHDSVNNKYILDEDGNVIGEKKVDLINKLNHFILEK